VVADISGCFDNISHAHIVNSVQDFPAAALISTWLTAGILEEGVFVETIVGFPQVVLFHSLLFNIALHGLGTHVRDLSMESKRPIMVRYADNFVLLCKSYESALEDLRSAEAFLQARGFKFKETSAPAVVHITQGFDFLGCTFKRISN